MPTWERLGQFVVSRRLELGYRQRQSFAEALGISVRTLGDLETGRRSSYDPTTLAAVENTLGWEAGSALRVANGGDPTMKGDQPAGVRAEEKDEAIRKVMLSDRLTEEQKRAIMQVLIEQRKEAERQRLRQAEEFIRIVSGEGL